MGDTTIIVAAEATCPPAEVRGRDDGPARIHLAR
jgi:hypothetical protein